MGLRSPDAGAQASTRKGNRRSQNRHPQEDRRRDAQRYPDGNHYLSIVLLASFDPAADLHILLPPAATVDAYHPIRAPI
jgi:hypothetical protein